MKIQNLAVIFIIIILPISLILNAYVGNQVKTLSLQISYDTKLNNATYDALKAFQLNTINSDTSDLANSKLRDIEASANTFFNSITSNFNMAGYNKDILREYVPALVYTMYDGYYIYSPYTNTLDATKNEIINDDGTTEMKSDVDILQENDNATYRDGNKIFGLKPYIYYSCRYKLDNGDDFVITYSLDNYITIQGEITVNGKKKGVYDTGYLLDTSNINLNPLTYRGVTIEMRDTTEENVFNPEKNRIEKHQYIKLNGIKYYRENNNSNKWFSILNGEKLQQGNFTLQTTAAIEYYKEAREFTNRVLNDYNLKELTGENAVGENESAENELKSKLGNYKIFESDNNISIEDPNSNFNQQRLAVIRYSIEKNLPIALANYNNYTGVQTNFQMPTLREDEWDKIINNVSIISFLQGLNIGGKVYNGYSIITNNKNQEVVNEDSIYILTDDNQYHRANDSDLINNGNIIRGVLNIDFERKSNTDSNGVTHYFFPIQDNLNHITGCYGSIVTQTSVNATDNLYDYMGNQTNKAIGSLASKYFTALGRERYGMYKTNNDPAEIKEKFIQ